MAILGISAFFHDSAAALVAADGTLLGAAQEERFTRLKHDSSFPAHAVHYCLELARQAGEGIEHAVFYENPAEKFVRIMDGFRTLGRDGEAEYDWAFPQWAGGKLDLGKVITDALRAVDPAVDWPDILRFTEHHAAHAASAFYPSPFEEAAVLVLDGVGERTTSSVFLGAGDRLEKIKEITFPHSLGLLYSAFTFFAGFKVNSGEYKLMGLAPYGEPRYRQVIEDRLIHIAEDGSYRIAPDYFDHFSKRTIINDSFAELFDVPRRLPEQPIEQAHCDLAASIQAVVEEVILRMGHDIAAETGAKNLCLAGGVALNCVANGRLLRQGSFEGLWVQPAAGDAGGSLGAALLCHYQRNGRQRPVPSGRDAMQGALLGPAFEDAEIERQLTALGAKYETWTPDGLLDYAAGALADGKTLAWFQGRMEFGPRALGNRSILADPRRPDMQRLLNLKVKKRESFRPFAPAVLAEAAGDWFDLDADSPYMLLVAEVADNQAVAPAGRQDAVAGLALRDRVRSTIPAVTHVDMSARVQTVHAETNPLFHALIRKFRDRTGCPVLVNTSFNVRGEPIVCSPADAFRCFVNTDLDLLAVGPYLMRKEAQDSLVVMGLAQTFADD